MPGKMKTVIVGGSSGMGLSTAQLLHKEGHEVVIAGRSQEKLEQARGLIGEVEAIQLDFTHEREVEHFFHRISHFDHLVITAAIFKMTPFIETSVAEAKAFFDNKFWGQYIVAKHAAPLIRKDGSITLFSGLAAQKPFPGFAAGSAINGAVESLGRALALELAPLRVNVIAPGTVDTPAWNDIPLEERALEFKALVERLPARRVGMPKDVAVAVSYLINCPFATGTTLHIDGGAALI